MNPNTSEVASEANSQVDPNHDANPESPKHLSPRDTAIAEINTRLLAQYATLRTAEFEHMQSHAETSALKKKLEKHQADLNRIVGELASVDGGQLPLPFDEVVEDDAWRAVSLDTLGIRGKLADTLCEANLPNLGAIADYTAAGKLLTDIEGVGAAKAEKVEEACAAYWAANPRGGEPETQPGVIYRNRSEGEPELNDKLAAAFEGIGLAVVDA